MGIVNEMGHFDAGVPIKNTKACPDMNGRPPFNTIQQKYEGLPCLERQARQRQIP
jgi:hypothetical protein